jgi:hypothetical protein
MTEGYDIFIYPSPNHIYRIDKDRWEEMKVLDVLVLIKSEIGNNIYTLRGGKNGWLLQYDDRIIDPLEIVEHRKKCCVCWGCCKKCDKLTYYPSTI